MRLCKYNRIRNAGITILELAIVMAIIALITGGIIGASTLIRQAELRTITADANKYKKAAHVFIDKFEGLPGDFKDAESFWGADASCPNTTTNTVLKVATCNGNGDKKVYDAPNSTEQYESFRFWQQLSNGEIIDEKFSGVRGSAGARSINVGINTPASEVDNSSFHVAYFGKIESSATVELIAADEIFDDNYGHVFIYGVPNGNNFNYSAAITPEEALGIDNKSDDGNVNSGDILSLSDQFTANANCVTSAPAYDTSYSEKACMLIFKAGF